jgi:hypothetical protein
MIVTLLIKEDGAIGSVLLDGAPLQNVAAVFLAVGEGINGYAVSDNVTVPGAQALTAQMGEVQKNVFTRGIAAAVAATAARLEQDNEQPTDDGFGKLDPQGRCRECGAGDAAGCTCDDFHFSPLNDYSTICGNCYRSEEHHGEDGRCPDAAS